MISDVLQERMVFKKQKFEITFRVIFILKMVVTKVFSFKTFLGQRHCSKKKNSKKKKTFKERKKIFKEKFSSSQKEERSEKRKKKKEKIPPHFGTPPKFLLCFSPPKF